MSSPRASEASCRVWRTAGWSPQASSMPTDCEPWPGKDECEWFHTGSRKMCAGDGRGASWAAASSVVQQDRAPGEAAAHAFEHQRVALLDALPLRTAWSSASGIEAAEVLPCSSTVTTSLSNGSFSFLAVPCMMRMLAWCGISQSMSASVRAGLGQHGARGLFEHADRQLEHRLAVHLEQRVAQHLASGHGSRHAKNADMLAVGMQVARENARLCRDASSTTAPAPSPNSTQVVRSLKSRMRENTSAPITRALLHGAGLDHRVGHGQRIHEAAADRLHVEGRATGDAQLVLQDDRPLTGKIMSGVDVATMIRSMSPAVRPAASRAWRAACSARSLRAHFGGGEMAGPDAGSLHDPLVGRFKTSAGQLGRQVGIGDAARRQIAAGAGNARITGRNG